MKPKPFGGWSDVTLPRGTMPEPVQSNGLTVASATTTTYGALNVAYNYDGQAPALRTLTAEEVFAREVASRALALDDTRRFLEHLFSGRGAGEVVIRPFQAGNPLRASWARTVEAALAVVAKNYDQPDLYVGVGRRIERDHTDDSVVELSTAWVDIDPPKLGTVNLDVWRMGTVERLRAFSPAPSLIVDSGRGVHAYWLLKEPAESAVVRAVNVALVQALDSDPSAVNAGRIMRIPGTLNSKCNRRARLLVDTGVRYYLTDLPGVALVVSRPARADLARPVLDLLVKNLQWQLGHDKAGLPKASGKCPFHPDDHASAVVFHNGFFHCKGCGVSEPLSKWSRRPEVASWAPAPPSSRNALVGTGGLWKAPHPATDVQHALVSHAQIAAVTRRSGEPPSLYDRPARDAEFSSPEDVVRAILAGPGRMLVQLFWLNIMLAQRAAVRTRGPVGDYSFRLAEACGLLGFMPDAKGKYPGSARVRVGKVQVALTMMGAMKIRLPVPTAMGAYHTAPLVTDRGLSSAKFPGRGQPRRSSRYALHPAIVAHLNSKTPAWSLWHEHALRLEDEPLAIYQLAQRQRSQRHGGASGEHLIDLAQLAHDAGVPWNEDEYRSHRRAYLERWARRFEVAGDAIGLAVDLDSGEAIVTAPRLNGYAPRALPPVPPRGSLT